MSTDKVRRLRETQKYLMSLTPMQRRSIVSAASSKVCREGDDLYMDYNDLKRNVESIYSSVKKAVAFLLESGFISRRGEKYIVTKKGEEMFHWVRETMKQGWEI